MNNSRRALALLLLCGACFTSRDWSWGLDERRSLTTDLDAETRGGGVRFQIAVPTGVSRTSLALAARNTLVVGDHAEIIEADEQGPSTVSGLGEVLVGASARVGFVYGGSARRVLIRENAIVEGFVKGGRAVEVMVPARIAIGTLAGIYDPGEMSTWVVEFPGAIGAKQISHPFERQDVAPGAYTALVVEPRSTSVLHEGQYFFDALDVEGGGRLEIHDRSGPVYVWVRNWMEIAGAVVPEASLPRTLFGFAGVERVRVTLGGCI